MNASDILRRHGIDDPHRGARGEFNVVCPHCGDSRKKENQHKKPLSVKIDDVGVVWKCHNCGVEGGEKYDRTNSGARPNGKTDEPFELANGSYRALHDYHDANGNYLYTKIRRPKCWKGNKCTWARRLPDGTWLSKQGNRPRALYRLPDVIAAIAEGRDIAVFEGEGDVDRAWELGVPATCSPHGAADLNKDGTLPTPKWVSGDSEQLRGAGRVVVFCDNDRPGELHQAATANSLARVVQHVCTVRLADHWPEVAKPGGDVSDGIDAGRTGEILALMDSAPEWKPDVGKSSVEIVRCSDLRDMRFDPLNYVTEDYIPEGLTILGGKPKIGKSWMLLDLGAAVATEGATFLGRKCQHGDVLGLFLEDGKRRLQRRLTAMHGISKPWPERFEFSTSWPHLDQGGMEEIERWCDRARDPQLIIIDILEQIKQRAKTQNLYSQDYDALLALREFCERNKLTIIGSMHQRKQGADDLLDTINSTLGSAAAADTVLVLARDNKGDKYLYGRGRDIEEFKITVCQNDHFRWQNLGSQIEHAMSSERASILNIMRFKGEPMTVQEIIDGLNKSSGGNTKPGNVRTLLSRMANVEPRQVVAMGGGLYALPGAQEAMPF